MEQSFKFRVQRVGLGSFVLLVTVGVLGLPIVSLAQQSTTTLQDAAVQSRCWTKTDCESKGGIWGGTADYKNRPSNVDSAKCQRVPPGTGDVTALCFTPPPSIPLEIGIPGVTDKLCSVPGKDGNFAPCTNDASCNSGGQNMGSCRPGITGGFPGYLAKFYKFFVGFLAVAAVTLVTWGGFKRIMAAGSAERIKDANEVIFQAIIGLVLALIAYSLMSLVNPALVGNTLPLVEKVKPSYFGACPTYDQAKDRYDQGYYMYTCQGGNSPGVDCISDDDCGGGKCTVTNQLQGRPWGDTCGSKLVFGGETCNGVECGSSGQGCFPNPNMDNKYLCSAYLAQGTLSGGIEVGDVALQTICNGSSSANKCSVASPGGEKGPAISVSSKSSYAMVGCFKSSSSQNKYEVPCGNLSNLKGFALLVNAVAQTDILHEIITLGSGKSFWYAVDASTCGTSTVRPIADSAGNTDPNFTTDAGRSNIDWSTVGASKLFHPSLDSDGKPTGGSICDLSLSLSNGFKPCYATDSNCH